MASVGVRELRQNASALLDRVAATGESIDITDHGRLVARLVPTTNGGRLRTRDELIRDGVLRPGVGNPLDVMPIQAPPGTLSTDEILDDLRDDR